VTVIDLSWYDSAVVEPTNRGRSGLLGTRTPRWRRSPAAPELYGAGRCVRWHTAPRSPWAGQFLRPSDLVPVGHLADRHDRRCL